MWATPGSLHMVPTQAECSAPGLHKQGSANPEQRAKRHRNLAAGQAELSHCSFLAAFLPGFSC